MKGEPNILKDKDINYTDFLKLYKATREFLNHSEAHFYLKII